MSIEFELPVPDFEELTLVSSAGVRGPGDGAGEELKGRISVGGPHGFTISRERVATYPEAAEFIDQNAGNCEFYLVWLTASFAALGSPRLDSAAVKLTLSAGPQAQAPRVLDMKPLTDGDKVSLERTLLLGPTLKLHDAVEAELGHAEWKKSYERTDLAVRGLGRDSSIPRWEFTRTGSRKLEGDCRLVLIVQAEAGSPLTVAGEVTASTAGNAAWPFKVRLPRPLHFNKTIS